MTVTPQTSSSPGWTPACARSRLPIEEAAMPRHGMLTIEIPRWVADEADLTVHLCAEDACLARAMAIGAGARRVAAARAQLAKGHDALAKARSRRLPAADRLWHLLRAERAFIEGHGVAERAEGRGRGP